MPPLGEQVTYLRKPEELTPERRVMIGKEAQKIAKLIPLLTPPRIYAPLPPTSPEGIPLCVERWVKTTSATATYTLDNRPGITFSAQVELDDNNDHSLVVTAHKDDSGEARETLSISLAHYPNVPARWLSGLHIPGSSSFTFEQWIDALQNIQETLDLVKQANEEKYGAGNLKDALGISAGLNDEEFGARCDELRALQEQLDPQLNYPTAEELAVTASETT